eukprot:scaffold17361_cov53-Cyclotella_meneghiniana.AAC.5
MGGGTARHQVIIDNWLVDTEDDDVMAVVVYMVFVTICCSAKFLNHLYGQNLRSGIYKAISIIVGI